MFQRAFRKGPIPVPPRFVPLMPEMSTPSPLCFSLPLPPREFQEFSALLGPVSPPHQIIESLESEWHWCARGCFVAMNPGKTNGSPGPRGNATNAPQRKSAARLQTYRWGTAFEIPPTRFNSLHPFVLFALNRNDSITIKRQKPGPRQCSPSGFPPGPGFYPKARPRNAKMGFGIRHRKCTAPGVEWEGLKQSLGNHKRFWTVGSFGNIFF